MISLAKMHCARRARAILGQARDILGGKRHRTGLSRRPATSPTSRRSTPMRGTDTVQSADHRPPTSPARKRVSYHRRHLRSTSRSRGRQEGSCHADVHDRGSEGAGRPGASARSGPAIRSPSSRSTSSQDATGDHQWLHVDVGEGEAGGRTTAPSPTVFLTVSLLPVLLEETASITGVKADGELRPEQAAVPGAGVPVGSTVRGTLTLNALEEAPQRTQARPRLRHPRRGRREAIGGRRVGLPAVHLAPL